jgi:Zn-dependent M28 family amino/carboxypeptidase
LAEKLDQLGAAALLIISDHPDTENTKLVRTPHLKRLGVMTVSGNTALRMGRQQQCNFRVQIEARNFTLQACNIAARFKRPAAKKVVVGAHYDTAPGTSGAGDNATGVAVLIELARLFKGLDCPIEFVSFAGEEYGGARNRYPIGSYEYCRAHRKELKQIAVFCALDLLGVYWGRNVVQLSKSKAAQTLERSIRNAAPSYSIERCRGERLGGDCLAFDDQGIPCLWLYTDYRYIQIHTPKDEISNIDAGKLAENCETASRLLARLALRG